MEKLEGWPPPDWTEVVIPWNDLLEHTSIVPTKVMRLLQWVDQAPGGMYHLHGWKSIEGFAFRFERPEDATYFRLRWL